MLTADSTNVPLDQLFPNISSISSGTSSVEGLTSFGEPVETSATTTTFSNPSAATPEEIVSERLYTVYPRSAQATASAGGLSLSYTADRGKIASIRLLTNSVEALVDRTRELEIDVSSQISQLTSGGDGFQDFILTDVNISYNEKTQITTTFGDSEVVYYFGRQPITFAISGILIDSLQFDWFSKFVALYQTVFRGTQLAKNFELVELTLPNMVIVGTIAGFQHQQTADSDTNIYFSMQFIAKQVTPISIPDLSNSTIQSINGTIIDFSVGKEGVGGSGYKLETASGSVSGPGSLIDTSAISKTASDFAKTLNSFRSSIFSPIYGIISSITKIIKTSSGDITKIVSSFTSPVNAILRDITNIATKAVAIANLIEMNTNQIIGIPDRVVTNTKNTLNSLKNSSGVISRVPENLSQIFKRTFNKGRLKQGAAILKSGKNNNKSKTAVLASGKPYSPLTAYTL